MQRPAKGFGHFDTRGSKRWRCALATAKAGMAHIGSLRNLRLQLLGPHSDFTASILSPLSNAGKMFTKLLTLAFAATSLATALPQSGDPVDYGPISGPYLPNGTGPGQCTSDYRLRGAKQIIFAYNLVEPGERLPYLHVTRITYLPSNPNGGPAIPVAIDRTTTYDFALGTRQLFSRVTGLYTDYNNGTTIIHTNVTLGVLHSVAIPVTFYADVYLFYDLADCLMQKIQAFATIPTQVGGVEISPPILPQIFRRRVGGGGGGGFLRRRFNGILVQLILDLCYIECRICTTTSRPLRRILPVPICAVELPENFENDDLKDMVAKLTSTALISSNWKRHGYELHAGVSVLFPEDLQLFCMDTGCVSGIDISRTNVPLATACYLDEALSHPKTFGCRVTASYRLCVSAALSRFMRLYSLLSLGPHHLTLEVNRNAFHVQETNTTDLRTSRKSNQKQQILDIMSGQGFDNTSNYNFDQVDPDLLEAANALDEHGIPWNLDYCLFCNEPRLGPHAADCPLQQQHPAQIPNHAYIGVQSYGDTQGMIATPTPVRTGDMPAEEVRDAYAPPTQSEENLMQPLGPVRLNPYSFGQQPPSLAAPMFTSPLQYASTPQPLPTTPVPPDQIAYTGYFKSFAEAQSALQPQQTDPILSLNIPNDDWQQIKTPNIFHTYASRLLSAIQQIPTSAPKLLTSDFARQYYFDHQSNTLTSILNALKSNPIVAEARILVCLQEVLDIHEFGLPASVLNRTSYKQGYKIEGGMLCSERLERVIYGALNDKYIAHDILSGLNVKDYVRSPNRFLQRKQENCRVNSKKALDKKTLDLSMGRQDERKGKGKVEIRKKNSVATKGRGERRTELLGEQIPLPDFATVFTPNEDVATPDTMVAATPNSNADIDFAGQGDLVLGKKLGGLKFAVRHGQGLHWDGTGDLDTSRTYMSLSANYNEPRRKRIMTGNLTVSKLTSMPKTIMSLTLCTINPSP
ncbi:uncharacterized protein MYCFIDRAFT_178849 [Pseudocercospora fijiensis CIRAD86]|uniref:Uncharacterized protein n=1 Tax=Pseudocercospora fijiensis (strain CIRAD86) TaxID=383855 RepID=M3A2V3_PSEFD|nr:uncharacterized protein MYCFIDRAFT_178849 [Pseudocercospora fijiensis CIRAD86]EME78741.1 hypothetical protein MYCFIDRAFT_178849 [Pseudocercospora fijiensis CIRAD86]